MKYLYHIKLLIKYSAKYVNFSNLEEAAALASLGVH